MGRADKLIAAAKDAQGAAVEAEVQDMSPKPDDIPHDVWELIQETGELATRRLHEIISGPRFMRLRAGDQAKLIALAQNRAYGMPKQNNAATAGGKKRALAGDVTASELQAMADRTVLPEYSRVIPKSED